MKIMWIVVVIAFLIGAFGGYYYEKTKMDNLMMMSTSSLQQQVSDLKMKNDDLMKQKVTPQPSGAMMHESPTPTGEMMKY